MIHYDMPMHTYLLDAGIGSSLLKKVLITPKDFKAAWDGEAPMDETPQTILGTAVHTAILEPNVFDERYALQPEDWGPRNAGKGHKMWAEFKINNQGRICLGWQDARLVKRIYNEALRNKELTKLLNEGRPEVTAFATHDTFRIPMKARTDLFCENTGILGDLKTTSESLADENIFKIIFNFGYHFQAAHHGNTFEHHVGMLEGYRWIFVSTKSPAIHIRIVEAPDDLLAWGARDHRIALETVKRCQDAGEWPGYTDKLTLEIPDWARKIYA